MIIEFIGTPGAGKTTLLPAVAAFFEDNGLRAYTAVEAARPFAARTLPGKLITALAPQTWQRPLLWQLYSLFNLLYQLPFLLQHPRLSWRVLTFQQQRPISGTDRRHVLRWFFHHAGRVAFLQAYARPDEVLLFDEGFVHRVVQLYASEHETPDLRHMQTYLDQIPRPSLLIVPLADRDLCEQRVYRRGLWVRFQRKSAAAVARYMDHAHTAVTTTVDYLKRKEWMVVEVQNGAVDTAVAAADLRHQLTRLTRTPDLAPHVQPGA